MRHMGRCFIGALLFSMAMFLMILWIGPNLTKPRPSPALLTAPPPIVRQSVTLSDGSDSYYLNLTNFEEEFPHLQSYRCSILHKPNVRSDGDQKLLILAVKSHPRTGARRAALRNTWATERNISDYRVIPVFLLGETPLTGHMELVTLESREYGDILQWDIMEGHHNLSLKERCLLEWLHLDLPHVDFIFKGDDDEFVNLETIVQFIREHSDSRTVHGYHQRRPGVMRHTKYSISKSLYPQERYPGFVSGGGFLYPGAAVRSLYEASQLLPVFPLDDVYFGFLALRANMTFRHDRRFHVAGLKYAVCSYKQALVVHGVPPEKMGRIWQEVQNTECGGPKPVQN